MPTMRLNELCEAFTRQGFAARLEGDDRPVSAVATLEEAGEGDLTFLSNPKYERQVADTKASAIIAADRVAVPPHLSAIRCADPYAGMTMALVLLHGYRRHPQWGRSPSAAIHPSATLGEAANVAPHVTICEGAVIGENFTAYPGSYVGPDARIGNDCTLYPNVVVYDGCELGDRVTIHAGSVVGQDGLGYAPHKGRWIKIPQVGRTVIGDDVEIGANCAIDRATLGETVVGAGTKFGNVIVIGHGTKVGPDCMFVGQVGVAGSVTVGRHVTLAGQVGVAGHLKIGDDVSIAAQSGIMTDIAPGSQLLGSPALPLVEAKRVIISVQQLPAALKRLQRLQREVEELKEQLRTADRKSD